MQGGQLLHFASRALTDTEKFYSEIYKGKLNIVFGLTRFHLSRKVTVNNDHKSLLLPY